MNNKTGKLKEINGALKPPDELGGVFLPRGDKERFDIMFVAEMPTMIGPTSEKDINFNRTARDMFLQEMMRKYGVAGSYVTDIVKECAKPGIPAGDKICKWRPFLLQEIEIIGPRAIVVLGRRTYESSFRPFVQPYIGASIIIDYVYHYCSQVPRRKFEERFAEVIGKIKSAP
jgi:uracil-DNA glycosylase